MESNELLKSRYRLRVVWSLSNMTDVFATVMLNVYQIRKRYNFKLLAPGRTINLKI